VKPSVSLRFVQCNFGLQIPALIIDDSRFSTQPMIAGHHSEAKYF